MRRSINLILNSLNSFRLNGLSGQPWWPLVSLIVITAIYPTYLCYILVVVGACGSAAVEPLHPPPLKPAEFISNYPFYNYFTSCKFMFKIFGASSLYHSVNSIEEEYLREEVQKLVHSFPGLNINPKSKSDVTNFLISESLRYEHFIIWHDLINNTITQHPKHPEVTPLEVTCLLEKLRGLPNLFCIVYCHREGAPEIFDSLRSLPCFIINITQHILSPTEKSDNHIIEKYRKLHQSPDLELRTLSAILHHYPRIERLFKTRGQKRRNQVEKREAKRQKKDNA